MHITILQFKLVALLLLMLFQADFIQCQIFRYPVSSINPVKTDYPGGRGPDELIIYNKNNKSKNTGTNQYGVEAIIINNRIISIGKSNNQIPENGFVISGHGLGSRFINNNARIGALVAYSDKEVQLTIDLECLSKEIQYKIENTQAFYEKALQNIHGMDFSATEVRIKEIEKITPQIDKFYARRDSLSIIAGFKKIDSLLSEILFMSTESPFFEARGAWHRPKEKNRGEIIKILDKMQRANFNQIHLETIWNGETIYPGKITSQNKEFKNFDPLQIYIEEGEKRGIEVHAWVHTFFVGFSEKTGGNPGPILKRHPDWAVTKRDGSHVSNSEKSYLFLCPAKPEVQEYIALLYKEIAIRYPKIGGLQLDYIRYPENTSNEENFCYCSYCRSEFQKNFGVDPINITENSEPDIQKAWQAWRENNITRFVERIRKENENVILSADIFPDSIESTKTKMQNWSLWLKKRYLDFIAPMVYSLDASWVNQKTKEIRNIAGKEKNIYCGLGLFMGLKNQNLVEQINTVRTNSNDGIIFFSLSGITDELFNLLLLGPFREKALIPHKYKK